jgi:hypothetical protein
MKHSKRSSGEKKSHLIKLSHMCVSASDKIRVVIPDNLVNKSKNDNDSATKDLFSNELLTAQQYITN